MADHREQYQDTQQFEHELINRRLTWLLTSQTILFAALAFVVGNEDMTASQKMFSDIIAILGMSISLAILLGVLMAIIAKTLSWRDAKAKLGKQQFGVRTWITWIAFIPDIIIPIAFTISWYWIRNGL